MGEGEPSDSALIHATSLAFGPFGFLIQGEPGTGKTHLALSLVAWAQANEAQRFCSLVSDDYTRVTPYGIGANARLIAEAPETITGLIELRGVGVRPTSFVPRVVVTHLIDLDIVSPERLPGEASFVKNVAGVSVARLPLRAHDPHNLPIILTLLGSRMADAKKSHEIP